MVDRWWVISTTHLHAGISAGHVCQCLPPRQSQEAAAPCCRKAYCLLTSSGRENQVTAEVLVAPTCCCGGNTLPGCGVSYLEQVGLAASIGSHNPHQSRIRDIKGAPCRAKGPERFHFNDADVPVLCSSAHTSRAGAHYCCFSLLATSRAGRAGMQMSRFVNDQMVALSGCCSLQLQSPAAVSGITLYSN